MSESDVAQVERWLGEPHVRRWWDDSPADPYPDVVLRDFGRAIRGEEPTSVFIATVGGRSIGVIQRYRYADYPGEVPPVPDQASAIGVDLFIGETSELYRGHGPALIRAFLVETFAREAETVCYIDPAATNRAAIRAYEKVGFRHVGTRIVPTLREPEYLMRLDASALLRSSAESEPLP